MTHDPSLITFARATITRAAGGEVLFRDLTWALRDGETWAVVGPVGSGKTAFAEVLLGRHPVRSGVAAWPILDRARAAGRKADFPADVVRLVAFKEESRLFSYGKHYYQERFNFTDPLDDVTLGDYLRAGTTADVEDVAERLGVGGLLGNSFLTLSNGQVRRARVARALLTRPELLILDDPFMGLDAVGRADVSRLLGGLAAGGTRVLLICRPELVPDWATHVLEFEGMAVKWQGRRSDLPTTLLPASPLGGEGRGGGYEASTSCERRPLPVELTPHPNPPPQGGREQEGNPPPQGGREPEIIVLRSVTVAYGGRPVMDRVTWTVRRGERWALLGPNGSGKTTLLSLVCGDHPQAYAADVSVFGRRRGTGESIWDVKRRIGLVSPELHLYFTHPMTAHAAAATGFFDVVTPRPTTSDQDAAVDKLFAEFGLADVADRPFGRLSTGQQRLVLLVRALVKAPELLILDEPFQGLDRPAVEHARAWLDAHLTADQTLVFVTHHPDEVPASVTRMLRLDGGRVAEVV
ncbi:MAG TPA: ATP-binding cassette domain-containing protein [Fimbriiglobus sp.]|nr:ATP-binding cassette domain-containing protein [Fimbriiglobus sp.]